MSFSNNNSESGSVRRAISKVIGRYMIADNGLTLYTIEKPKASSFHECKSVVIKINSKRYKFSQTCYTQDDLNAWEEKERYRLDVVYDEIIRHQIKRKGIFQQISTNNLYFDLRQDDFEYYTRESNLNGTETTRVNGYNIAVKDCNIVVTHVPFSLEYISLYDLCVEDLNRMS